MDGINIDSVYSREGQGAVKVERPLPDYRLVLKNGTLGLQRAYGWACGTDGGVDWRDEPTIDLDAPPAEL
jgi:hypothetical protein